MCNPFVNFKTFGDFLVQLSLFSEPFFVVAFKAFGVIFELFKIVFFDFI